MKRTELAQFSQCTLQIPGWCLGAAGRDTVVACHSNWGEHGKGVGLKADDEYTVFGCRGCHDWLDSGPAPDDEKRAEFERARKHTDRIVAVLTTPIGTKGG